MPKDDYRTWDQDPFCFLGRFLQTQNRLSDLPQGRARGGLEELLDFEESDVIQEGELQYLFWNRLYWFRRIQRRALRSDFVTDVHIRKRKTYSFILKRLSTVQVREPLPNMKTCIFGGYEPGLTWDPGRILRSLCSTTSCCCHDAGTDVIFVRECVC